METGKTLLFPTKRSPDKSGKEGVGDDLKCKREF
jgi:hypothetical protein